MQNTTEKTPSSKKEILVVTLLLLLIGGLIFWGSLKVFGNLSKSDTIQEQAEKTEPAVYRVGLDKNKKEPISLEVKLNEYVQFDSEDGQQHQIVQAGDGEHGSDAIGGSEPFGGEEGYRMQFKDIGTYYLQDKFNPELKINVIVKK